jgi:GNAT superfamily N-acetyltransferase
MGWNPPLKKLELFHRDSRFVIMRRPQAEDDPDSLCAEVPIVAYSMFRFDMEDNECVLYWYFVTFNFILRYPIPLGHSFKLSSYELQVSQSAQRGGIGKTLMKCLYDIAHGWKMQKVMLTVFKGEEYFIVIWTFPPRSEPRLQRTKQHSYFTRPWGLCAIFHWMYTMC